jgi:hypothetical protein
VQKPPETRNPIQLRLEKRPHSNGGRSGGYH